MEFCRDEDELGGADVVFVFPDFVGEGMDVLLRLGFVLLICCERITSAMGRERGGGGGQVLCFRERLPRRVVAEESTADCLREWETLPVLFDGEVVF
jgi:hypothetical protein